MWDKTKVKFNQYPTMKNSFGIFYTLAGLLPSVKDFCLSLQGYLIKEG